MPALVIGGLFHQFAIGVPMTVGAFALAMLDQYGGQKKDRLKEFISACFLSALVALIAGFSSGYMVTLFIGVALICFCCAMLNRSEEHTSELQSRGHLVCRLLLEKI